MICNVPSCARSSVQLASATTGVVPDLELNDIVAVIHSESMRLPYGKPISPDRSMLFSSYSAPNAT